MHTFLSQQKHEFDSPLDFLQKSLGQLRTGRATPALVENIYVEAYGSKMELKGLASLAVQDVQTLIIEPWDKQILKAIESAIQTANIGVQPVVDGTVIRLSLPKMTEETRKQLVKNMKEFLEETRVRVRAVREKIREQVIKKEKEKQFTEDEKFKLLEELDKLTRDYIDRVDQTGVEKEKEILTI